MTAAPLPRIFVQIPSYRDRECQWTIQSLFLRARHPERIFVGVCWQTDPELDRDCFQIETRRAQVRALHFHWRDARGLGWARQQAQSLWQGEEYTLQIDSHMRFVQDWDEKMLSMLAACNSPDPVLTVYPPPYFPPDKLDEASAVPRIQSIRWFRFDGVLQFTAHRPPEGQPMVRPLPTAACAGGFIFGTSRIIRDVPSDPHIYFLGEEPNLAVRLFTHGFDLFSPNEVVIYHYYGRQDGVRVWDDFSDNRVMHGVTQQRMKALCEPANCSADQVAALEIYGLGSRRTLADYEAFSGAHFSGRTLLPFAKRFPYVRHSSEKRPADDRLVSASGTCLFVLDCEGLLFDEKRGEFFRLNPSAMIAWSAREDGMAWGDIAAQLAHARSIAYPDAERELENLVEHWQAHRLLHIPGEEIVPDQPEEDATPPNIMGSPNFEAPYFRFRTRRYRLLGALIEVRYSDLELEQWVHPVLAHLESTSDEGASHRITVARILDYIFVFDADVQLHRNTDPATLAPIVKAAVLRNAVDEMDHILSLHAGAVLHKGHLILLPAASGSGKTLLTARLLAAGCTYYSDEIALLERNTGRIRPVPISLCVKDGGAKILARYFPEIADLPVHARGDGHHVRYLPPPEQARPTLADHDCPQRPALLVFPRYSPDAPTSARPISLAEAFSRLLTHDTGVPQPLTIADAAILMDVMEGTRCYELTGSDLDAAAEMVLDLCEQAVPA